MTIRFHRRCAGHYWIKINGIEYELYGPDPCYSPTLGYEWSLETSELGIDVEHFRTMGAAREYLETLSY